MLLLATKLINLIAFVTVDQAKRCIAVEGFVRSLNKIINWFEMQTNFQFYGSSLLHCYDAETGEAEIRMIDFNHVFYENMIDENYLFGLRNLHRDFHSFFFNKYRSSSSSLYKNGQKKSENDGRG